MIASNSGNIFTREDMETFNSANSDYAKHKKSFIQQDERLIQQKEKEGISLTEDDTPLSKEPYSHSSIKNDFNILVKSQKRASMIEIQPRSVQAKNSISPN